MVLLLAAAGLATGLAGCGDDPAKPNGGSTPTSPLTVDGSDDFFVAGGASRGGVLLSSFSPGSWNTDDVTPELTPFDGTLNQIVEGPAGTLYAVGGRRTSGATETAAVLLERAP